MLTSCYGLSKSKSKDVSFYYLGIEPCNLYSLRCSNDKLNISIIVRSVVRVIFELLPLEHIATSLTLPSLPVKIFYYCLIMHNVSCFLLCYILPTKPSTCSTCLYTPSTSLEVMHQLPYMCYAVQRPPYAGRGGGGQIVGEATLGIFLDVRFLFTRLELYLAR